LSAPVRCSSPGDGRADAAIQRAVRVRDAHALIVTAFALGTLARLPRLVALLRVALVCGAGALSCFMLAALVVAPRLVACFGLFRLSRRHVLSMPTCFAPVVPTRGMVVVLDAGVVLVFATIVVAVMSAAVVCKGAATQQRDGKKTSDQNLAAHIGLRQCDVHVVCRMRMRAQNAGSAGLA
jgi:hypothetical protein